MLAASIRVNAEVPEAAEGYARLARAAGLPSDTPEALADAVAALVRKVVPRQRRPA